MGPIEIRYDTDGTCCQPDEYDRYHGLSAAEALDLFEAIQEQQKLALRWATREDEEIGPSTMIVLYRFCQNLTSWHNLRTVETYQIVAGKGIDEIAEMREDAIALAYCREVGEA